jgi:hypothetical protein
LRGQAKACPIPTIRGSPFKLIKGLPTPQDAGRDTGLACSQENIRGNG